MTGFLIMSMLIFGFLGFIWKSSTFVNVAIKYNSWVMAVWALILLLNQLGFIVQAPAGSHWF